MGKKMLPEEFTGEIKEFIGVLKESDKHDWCKGVAKVSWNGRPVTLDIRSMNLAKERLGKGISLTDEEADRLVDLLLENDYGSIETIQSALERKRSRFTILEEAADCFDDGPLVIDIKI